MGGTVCYVKVGDDYIQNYTMTRDGASWWLDFKHCGKGGHGAGYTPYYSVLSAAPFPPARGAFAIDGPHLVWYVGIWLWGSNGEACFCRMDGQDQQLGADGGGRQ